MTESTMWVEKYRPTKLSVIVNQKEIIGSLKSLLKNTAEMPHLIFSGLDTTIPFKLVILDEADEMTSDAQTALRRIIEDTSTHCRFIIIANNISKIIEPLQSRCAVFKFTRISEEDIVNHLEDICKKEKIKYNKNGLNAIYTNSEGDMRHSINMLQATASLGLINEDNVK